MNVKFTLPGNIKNTEKPIGYTSPYSDKPSDNASQGKITNGMLIHEFAPPDFGEDETELQSPYVYSSRIQTDSNHMNETLANKENYDGMPGFADSHLVSETYTQEQSLNLIVILVAIIAIIVVGSAFGWFCVYKCKKINENVNDDNIF